MSAQPFRLAEGGEIDRSHVLRFAFDGRALEGHAGDTLASALLANGIRLVGRSFKYHRPRGIMTAGSEEPNALVRLRVGSRAEPNTRATTAELYDGLVAESQNRFPSLKLDLGAVANLVAPLIPAGFYYKTFLWPADRWETYEAFIRRAAGLGRAADAADPDTYEKRHAHCDVLVVGGGPAGLAAALAAGRAGARVILVDETAGLGGSLRGETAIIDGAPATDWIRHMTAELAALPEIRLLTRTTAFGHYDHNLVAAIERVADHFATPPPFAPRQRLWLIRAREVVLATGAIERPLVFGGNDRPGVMLAGAARAYANRFAVRAGRRAVVFTNNDSGYRAALDLAAKGIEVAAIVDPREMTSSSAASRARAAGLHCLTGHVVVGARGGQAVRAAEVVRLDRPDTIIESIACDLLCVSGGWSPTLHLHCQSGGRPDWNAAQACFVPGKPKQRERAAGAANGTFTLAAAIAEGLRAGAQGATAAGLADKATPAMPVVDGEDEAPLRPLWQVRLPARRRGKRFVDIQDDVTAEDVALAAREGYRSVEHVKRYTTLGMGTDQGKTSNVTGLAILAELRDEEIPRVGTTTFRPPFTPVTLGAIAGREIGHHFEPTRRSAMHEWHERAGAVFVDAGLWLRPRYYPRAGETIRDAFIRETNAVRGGVGIVDVSTLGKIEIEGPDAAELLERVYVNSWRNLAIGRARYGLMLREDGMVFDDGTTSRLGPTRYLMTTTTTNAVAVMQHLDRLLQVVWPELRVQATSVTEQWAAMALAGPHARRVLERVVDDIDVSDAALPFMGVREGRVAGIPARVFRISFSGELAYEINVPADYGAPAWEALMEAGRSLGIVAYGTEAMAAMRIEKGHVAGAELDGRTTPFDLGMGRLVRTEKDFIGRRSLDRPALQDPNRKRLVGLVPVDGLTRVGAGAALVLDPTAPSPVAMLGHVTSVTYSPTLGHPIALALLARGLERKGERLVAASPIKGESVPVTVVDPVFVDPQGRRLRG
jgi:heterotetrameric sarcosine oxidase alpha subunit